MDWLERICFRFLVQNERGPRLGGTPAPSDVLSLAATVVGESYLQILQLLCELLEYQWRVRVGMDG